MSCEDKTGKCFLCKLNYFIENEICIKNNPVEGCLEREYKQVGGRDVGSINYILALPL